MVESAFSLAFGLCLLAAASAGIAGAQEAAARETPRRPANDRQLRFWLENMIRHHRFTTEEVIAATGLSNQEIETAIERWNLRAKPKPNRPAHAPIFVLPYPGGRHPRIGFLDGAVDPQRETKFSVFLPWDESSYVVADIPEAIWSNLGLTYLAHTHIPTVWTKEHVAMEPLEWTRGRSGALDMRRRLPNGIEFRTKVRPGREAVLMELRLINGSTNHLSDLRVQNCVMFKGAAGFNQQTNANKVMRSPYVACRSEDGTRWVVTAWDACHRPWANAPCPCMHSDPKFPDCGPGESRVLKGWLSFYEGQDIQAEFDRIDATGWRSRRSP